MLWFVEKLLRAFQTASCSEKEVLFGRRCNFRVIAGVKVTSVSCGPGRGIGGSGIVETQRLGSQLQIPRNTQKTCPRNQKSTQGPTFVHRDTTGVHGLPRSSHSKVSCALTRVTASDRQQPGPLQ